MQTKEGIMWSISASKQKNSTKNYGVRLGLIKTKLNGNKKNGQNKAQQKILKDLIDKVENRHRGPR